MKVSFIATGDAHLAMGVQTPAGRHPETFGGEQIAKLEFIAEYAEKNKVPFLIFPGDILNYKNPSLYSAKSINIIMKALWDLKSKVHVYSISGNHDLKMSSRQMKAESVYNIFTRGGVLDDINHWTVHPADGVTLSGIDYNPDPEDLWRELEELNETLSPDNTNIVVIHEHLVPPGDEVPFCHFINYDRFLDFKNFNIVVSGHLHKGYETMSVGEAVDIDAIDLDSEDSDTHSITFVNPWSLTRLARDNYAINETHNPELVHVDIDTDTKKITWKHVEIPHKSFDEAFIKSSLASVESRNLDISEFVSSLVAFEVETSSSTSDIQRSAPDLIKEKINFYLEAAGAT